LEEEANWPFRISTSPSVIHSFLGQEVVTNYERV